MGPISLRVNFQNFEHQVGSTSAATSSRGMFIKKPLQVSLRLCGQICLSMCLVEFAGESEALAAPSTQVWRETLQAVFQRGSVPEIQEGLILGAVLETSDSVEGSERSAGRGRWSGRWIESLQANTFGGKPSWPMHQLAAVTRVNAMQRPERWIVEVRYLGESSRSNVENPEGSADRSDRSRTSLVGALSGTQKVEIVWRRESEILHREILNLSWGVTGKAIYRPSEGEAMKAFVKLVRVRYATPQISPES